MPSVCNGAQFHSPTPLVLHDVSLPNGSIIVLCGTCLDNVKVYMDFEESHDWNAPWAERRKFGNMVRATGQMLHAEKVLVSV